MLDIKGFISIFSFIQCCMTLSCRSIRRGFERCNRAPYFCSLKLILFLKTKYYPYSLCIMLFIHAQMSSSAKQAVVICSIVAALLWCSGMIMCAIVCRNLLSCRHILNAEISQFSQCVYCRSNQNPPFNISAYGPVNFLAHLMLLSVA